MRLFRFFLLPFVAFACIGTDLVFDTIEEELRFIDVIDVLGFDDSYRFTARYFNEVGAVEEVPLEWKSSDTSIAEVDADGTVHGRMLGEVVISVCYTDSDTVLRIDHPLEVGEESILPVNPSRSGMVRSTSSYALTGAFTLTEEDNGSLTLAFGADYRASTALPGLYIYLTNNPTTTMGAYEIDAVQVFTGSHSYSLPASIGLNDYQYVLYFCKPFNVKVGDGRIN